MTLTNEMIARILGVEIDEVAGRTPLGRIHTIKVPVTGEKQTPAEDIKDVIASIIEMAKDACEEEPEEDDEDLEILLKIIGKGGALSSNSSIEDVIRTAHDFCEGACEDGKLCDLHDEGRCRLTELIRTVDIISTKAGKKKTLLDDFVEKYPDIPLDLDGTPMICARSLYPDITIEVCDTEKCRNCWNMTL